MRAITASATLVAIAVIVAGCGGTATSGPSASLASSAPSPPTSLAAQATRDEIVGGLAARSIGVEDARAPYRPPESPLLQSAPRLVLEAFMPDDPAAGQIVVYEFPTAGEAATAGREMAAYIASGPGRVNFTPDSVFVLRALGQTLIFFTYAPGSLTDAAAAAAVAEALSTMGTAIPITG